MREVARSRMAGCRVVGQMAELRMKGQKTREQRKENKENDKV